MPLTILFDLDDTLLSTNMDRFLPGYFKLLGETLSHLGTQEKITAQIQYAVEKMVANQDPGKTLKAVFAENFYPALGTTEAACQEMLDSFYQDEYPRLKLVTQTRPAAAELVEWCKSEGYVMAVATNPLFPHTATRQRIQWAALDPGDFAFFTSYNDFHFTKPHLSYYAEVLGRLGWPEGPIAMIGDNLAYDLFPIDTMGYDTFWVTDDGCNIRRESGTLSEVKPWLNQIVHNDGQDAANHPQVNIAILRSTPAVLDSCLSSMQSNPLEQEPRKLSEQLIETLSLLARRETQVFLPQWEQISQEQGTKTPVFDELIQPGKTVGDHYNPDDIFIQFLNARKRSLSFIEALNPKDMFDISADPDHDHRSKISTLVGAMAESDRSALRHLNNL